MKLLFANIGWMSHYRGNNPNDKIVGGGSWDNDDKHEVFNFMPIDGFCYGYVQPSRDSIRLNRIDSEGGNKEYLKDVLVVWVSTHPTAGGTYIVGWYKNATVYSHFQYSSIKSRGKFDYNIKAKENDCILLPIDRRVFLVPRATKEKNGLLGKSNVWFADKDFPYVIKFREEVIEYINSHSEKKDGITRKAVKVDVEAKNRVEKAAVDFVTKQYKNLGYSIKSREKDNIGWDLDATKGKIHLKLEVKGLAGSQISVHISANEYEKMNANKDDYRLCVVINAILSPKMIVFIYDKSSGAWVSDCNPTIKLSFDVHPTYVARVE